MGFGLTCSRGSRVKFDHFVLAIPLTLLCCSARPGTCHQAAEPNSATPNGERCLRSVNRCLAQGPDNCLARTPAGHDRWCFAFPFCQRWIALIGSHWLGAIRLITLSVRLSRIMAAVKTSNTRASATTYAARIRDATKKPSDIIAVSESEFRIESPT